MSHSDTAKLAMLELRADQYEAERDEVRIENARLRSALDEAITVIGNLASDVYGPDWDERALIAEDGLDDEIGLLRETMYEIREPRGYA